jgi:hypothetical protein
MTRSRPSDTQTGNIVSPTLTCPNVGSDVCGPPKRTDNGPPSLTRSNHAHRCFVQSVTYVFGTQCLVLQWPPLY